jgi:hypothetical protein
MSRFYCDCKFAPCSQTPLLAVRHGLETIWNGGLYRESFSPDCWLARATPATVQLSHDDEVVGEISAVVASGQWHHATLVLDDRPLVRERFRRGARISVGCRSIHREQDDDLRIVRHTLAALDHIAPVLDGQVAGHIGAVVTRVWEAPALPTRYDWHGLDEADEIPEHHDPEVAALNRILDAAPPERHEALILAAQHASFQAAGVSS